MGRIRLTVLLGLLLGSCYAVHAKPANFVILSEARSMSSRLCASIDRHPNATCFGETLRPNSFARTRQLLKTSNEQSTRRMDEGKLMKALLSDRLCDETNLCWLGSHYKDAWCESSEECAQHRRQIKGFKVFYHHKFCQKTLEFAAANNITVIHLIRASEFRRQISLQVALAAHSWGRHHAVQDELSGSKINIDVKQMNQAIDSHIQQARDWAEFLVKNRVRHKTLFYEELNLRQHYLPASQLFADVIDFIGLEPIQSSNDTEFITDIAFNADDDGSLGDAKNTPAPNRYYSVIGNIDELEKHFPYDMCELRHGSMLE